MRFYFLILFSLFFFIATSSYAAMQDYPIVKLQALDKSTARTKTFEVKVGSTIEYGSLFIKAQACRKSEPLDKPESASFLQVWEVPLNAEKSEWVFSGWMFASSPALSAMDHAVYDVWVLDCISNAKKPSEATTAAKKEATADQGELEKVKPVPENDNIIEDSEAEAAPSKTNQAIEKPIENVVEDAVNFE